MISSDEDRWLCEITDAGHRWGLVSLPVGPDDDEDIDPPEVERMLVSVFEDVVDNQWPDELTDPWPLCARHGDHPLQPGVTRGKASWTCSRDDAVAIPLGSLGGQEA